MADTTHFKMLQFLLLVILVINESQSATIVIKNFRSCGCYESCAKNFTTDLVKDIPKITSCQRGCRIYSLVYHTSNHDTSLNDLNIAKKSCDLSCQDSYKSSHEISACKVGCTAGESARMRCISGEQRRPKISYSLLIEESDVLVHPGETDSEDVLTDPVLRKQFDKNVETIFIRKSKLPEIHFRNLPVQNDKSQIDYSHINLKCPKFYGFDSKLEFRNGKIIIGDLYLFVGVFVFVVICFILGHHIEARSTAKQLAETKLSKRKEEMEERQLLLGHDFTDQFDYLIEKEPPPGYTCRKSIEDDQVESDVGVSDSKFEAITLIFNEDEKSQYQPSTPLLSCSPPIPSPSPDENSLKV